MFRLVFSVIVGMVLVSQPGCERGLPEDRAVRLVRAYNERLVEAYKVGDSSLVEKVSSPREAKKLGGLIGAKLDMGITLDSALLELEVLGVEQKAELTEVRTRERWTYLDRQIGTGKQVGEASTDLYEMLYQLRQIEGRWVVDEVRFAEPPIVGRKKAPSAMPASVAHGLAPPEEAPEKGDP